MRLNQKDIHQARIAAPTPNVIEAISRRREAIPSRQIPRLGNVDWLRDWCKGKEAWVIAGDGSLLGFRFDLLSKLHNAVIIAINVSIIEVPFADLLCFIDAGVASKAGFTPEKLRDARFKTVCSSNARLNCGGQLGVMKCQQDFEHWPSQGTPNGICSGSTSTHLGMSCALWGGASRVRILGAAANSMTPDNLQDFLAYTKRNAGWYDLPGRKIEQLRKHMQDKGLLQHYYGMDRHESHPNNLRVFPSHAGTYTGFAAPERKKCIVHNFMSAIRGIDQEDLPEAP